MSCKNSSNEECKNSQCVRIVRVRIVKSCVRIVKLYVRIVKSCKNSEIVCKNSEIACKNTEIVRIARIF